MIHKPLHPCPPATVVNPLELFAVDAPIPRTEATKRHARNRVDTAKELSPRIATQDVVVRWWLLRVRSSWEDR